MKTIAKKTDKKIFPILQFILGIFCILLAVAAVVAILVIADIRIFLEPIFAVIFGIFLITMIGGGSWLVGQYLFYKNAPEIVIEADEKYLYVHGKKESKKLISELDGTEIFGAAENLKAQLFFGGFGTVKIKFPDGEKQKLFFIDNAKYVPYIIIGLIEKA